MTLPLLHQHDTGVVDDDIPASPMPRIRSLVLSGAAVVGVFIGGFGAWSALAPLESAALAPGVVEVEGHHKTVQHLEGGIIGQILVKDGDHVTEGQVLLRLDDTKARTTYAALEGQLLDAYARQARLRAERDGLENIHFPDALRSRAKRDTSVTQTIAGQETIFAARHSLLASKITQIRERIRQSNEEIHGLQAQDEAARTRAGLIQQELLGVRELYNKGLERKAHLLQLEAQAAEITGNRGQLAAEIARAQQTIAEAEVDILTLRNDAANEVAQQLRDTEEKVAELEEQRQAAADVLSRVEIRAPESGVVTDLKVHTPGGVVRPGEPLLDIVPTPDVMVIRARVRPEDMDLVRVGLPASVRLLPYKQRRTPPLQGIVRYVSADRLFDDRQQNGQAGLPYFLAKIEISDEALRAAPEIKLLPGMPAEVMIKTGKTSIALYALSPLLDSFQRALSEK